MAIEALTFVSERTVSAEDFAAWVATRRDDARYELIEGRIVMTPPSAWPEGEGEAKVITLLSNFAVPRGLGRVLSATQGIELPTGDVVAPDAAFVSTARWDAARPTPGRLLRVVPDLLVELTTPDGSNRDRVEKRRIYAAAGVREYWIVDLRRREVTLFLAAGEGRFDDGRTLREDDTLASAALPGLAVPVRDLLVS